MYCRTEVQKPTESSQRLKLHGRQPIPLRRVKTQINCTHQERPDMVLLKKKTKLT
jgi:hypothetical protein